MKGRRLDPDDTVSEPTHVAAALSTYAEGLYRVLAGLEGELVSVHLKRRDDSTWLCVFKRYGDDGGLEVCFGGGYDPVGAMMTAGRVSQSGKWRPETPWRG